MLKKALNLAYIWRIPVGIVGILFGLLNMALILRKRPRVTELVHLDRTKLLDFFDRMYHRHPKLQSVKTKSSVYDEIFSEINMYDFLTKHSFQERCMIYFNHLTMGNPDWMVNPHENLVHNFAAFATYEQFHQQKLNDIERAAKGFADQGIPYTPPPEEEIRSEYDDMRQSIHNNEQTLHDYVAHVRVFEKCFMASSSKKKDHAKVKSQRTFLKNGVKYIKTKTDHISGKFFKHEVSCAEIETRIFPSLTKEFPLFTRWDGKTSLFPGLPNKFSQTDGCFLEHYKSRLNGKGIVLTIKDSHVDDAVRFLRLIRHLGNTYPVQIVYLSGLSEKSKDKLVQAAREPFRGYREQEIWFVNTERSIHSDFRGKFSGFSNKIMATMFNSFEHMLLCDADTVLLQNPSYFFNLKKYIDTGTFFYKDRTTNNYRAGEHIRFFQKLLPSVEDSMVFNVQQATDFTLDHNTFKGSFDYMESGVVAVNRKRHFIQPMMMSLLNFYPSVQVRTHGDKEYFWLALSLAGDESFAFNDNHAASIGELTPETERHKDISNVKSFRSQEICSNHPAHISDDNQTLVWFNSGFRFCGNALKDGMNWQEDFDSRTRLTHIKNLEEYKAFLSAPLKITHAIIPPVKTTQELLRNIEHEPEIVWNNKPSCMGYYWCAYSSAGGYYIEDGHTKNNIISGKVVAFTPEQIHKFEAARDAWGAGLKW
ncbi:hypothetical protein JCM33374_g6069 [Metschnikowia sp. JCM 33374]|nr:hypothetical protein JCM33374_g6069 [Metschnikowia sp. JCM 33374]